jgi:hypothetical protein
LIADRLLKPRAARTLRPQIAELIGGYSTGQMTYDLRRLRRKGLIRRIPRSQRYELTAFGRRTAVFFTKTYVRIVNPSLAELDSHLPEEITHQSPIARAWRAFEHALDDKIKQHGRGARTAWRGASGARCRAAHRCPRASAATPALVWLAFHTSAGARATRIKNTPVRTWCSPPLGR